MPRALQLLLWHSLHPQTHDLKYYYFYYFTGSGPCLIAL
jgi:hypothetical protein